VAGARDRLGPGVPAAVEHVLGDVDVVRAAALSSDDPTPAESRQAFTTAVKVRKGEITRRRGRWSPVLPGSR
jgi:hypothetical protein